MIAKIAAGSIQNFLSDRLSVRVSLDLGGNVVGLQGHLPFGENFGEGGTQEKHHFTSYERDAESSTDYAVNRTHLQTLGRFASVDRGPARLSDPQGLNRYTYSRNNPVNMVDPLGLWCQEWLHIEYWEDAAGIIIDWGATYTYWVCGPDRGSGSTGTGTGSGTRTPQGTELSRHNQREFRRAVLSSNCKKYLDEHGLTEEIIDSVEGVQFFDVDDPGIGEESAALLFADSTLGNITVDQFFTMHVDNPDPTIPTAFTVPLGVSPFPGIYARGGVGAFINAGGVNTGFLLHELAHYTTGKNDEGLWEMFDLPPPPEGMTYSDVLSDFFNNDCPDAMPNH